MHRTVRSIVLAAVVLGGSFAGAHLAAAYPIDADLFKCQKAVSKIQEKLFAAETKCILKCKVAARAGLVPFGDCAPPYPTTATKACIMVARQVTLDATPKACGKEPDDCPACYNDGDPVLEGILIASTISNDFDAILPMVYCSDLDGIKCMDATAKTIQKFHAAKTKCYDKCWAAAQKGALPSSACVPPSSDPAISECILKLEAKASTAIDKACFVPPAVAPGCYDGAIHAPAVFPSPQTGAGWIAFVETVVDGLVQTTYCGP